MSSQAHGAVSTEADIARLRKYRNEISHMISISKTKQEFCRTWNEIEQVIKRLGQGLTNLHQEIQNLKDNCIDPEKERGYQERIKEWEEMDKSLEIEFADRLNQLQKQTVDNTNKIGCLEQKHRESTACILANETKISEVETKQTYLQEQLKKNVEQVQEVICIENAKISSELTNRASVTDLYLEDIERDDVYVTTRAHKTAREKLDHTGCLILSGLPGEGKTTMAAKILSETTHKKFRRKLSSPKKWNTIPLNKEKPWTIFIDDIFGAGALNEKLVEKWSRHLPDIEKAIKAKRVKAIITTRHYILKEAKEKLRYLPILKDDNVQLLASYNLSNEEKTEILEKHLKCAKKEFDSNLITECIQNTESTSNIYHVPVDFEDFSKHKSMIGFPEIVSLFVRNEHLFIQGASFFGQPFLFFRKCIEELILDEEKFLALILVWASQSKTLKKMDVEPPDISDEIRAAANRFGINLEQKTSTILRKSLKYHEDGFLRFDPYDGTYYFSHNSVMDMVGLVAGQEYKSAVLEYANSEFLKQFVTTDKTKNDGLHIYVEQFLYKKLHLAICRALDPKELPEGKFKRGGEQIEEKFGAVLYNASESEVSVNTSILENDCFRNSDFVSQFCKSEEGKYMLSKPVDMLPQKCQDWFCDIDLGRNIPVYLPSLGLLYNSSLLLKEVFKQNLPQSINTTDFLQSTLLMASREGLKDVIEMVLQRGATVNSDPLFLAAANGHSESLEYLLQNFTENCTDCPNSINRNNPLIAASKDGSAESIKCLIRHGTNINYRNKNGWSALDKAVLYAQPDSCKILLENKALVNCKAGKFKRTPLHMNADVGDESITKMLLQYGASVTVKDYRGHYPLHCAAFSGNNEIVDILLKADESKVTVKHRISYGKNSIIKGASLYHVAVLKGNVDLIDILLQNKLCPNIRDFYGRTPLYLAIYGCKSKEKIKPRRIRWRKEEEDTGMQLKVIKKLLDHTDVCIAEKDGYTPLHAAVHKGHLETVKLLGPHADVNAQDKYGKTPLHTACEQMNMDIFKILVEDFRADYRMRTKSDQTIFDILAKKTELIYICRRLRYRKSVTDYMFEKPRFKSFRDIISYKDPDFVKQLISKIGIEEEFAYVDQSEQSEANEDQGEHNEENKTDGLNENIDQC